MPKILRYLMLFLLPLPMLSYAQCFQVNDGNGVLSNNPNFISCTPGNYTVFIQTDQTIGPYVIDWGDGSPTSTGASLVPPAVVQHTYAATTNTYTITITNSADGCVVTGQVIMERNPLASIQLPTGDDNFGCTPVQFRFINSSTQVSQNTTFEWDFGDGTPVVAFNFTNAGDTVFHTYLPGISVQSCDLEVRLTATNFCGASTASFFPLRVWDLDEAVITPSATLLCYPDTVVQYTNNTIRNCFAEGNQSQRYEKWNFGDYWGLGYDSIIGFRPWNPPIINPPPIAYPGIGTYIVMLIDSSFCGLDTTFETITIAAPPNAILTSNKDTICEGESVTFINNSTGAANEFFWDFDQGNGFVQLNGNNKTRTFNNSGDYTIRLAIGIAGAGSCVDTASVDIYVNPSPGTAFTFSPDDQCDSATVSFTNTSTGNIVNYDWTFGNGNTFSGSNPPPQFYPSPGIYPVKLVTENDRGCLDSITQNVRVRQVPVADFTVTTVCLNQVAQFIDASSSPLDPITSYKWYFGDGDSSTAQNPGHLYTSFGTFQVVQIVDNGFCQDSDTLLVTVENNPTAAFTVDRDNGCSRLTVNFTNASSANAVSFNWNFGDGSAPVNAQDTSHTFTNAGNSDTSFVVRMIAQTAFGCADTTYDTIRVFPIPVPSFTSDAVLDCGPLLVNFNNTTQGDSLNFFWNFGDGSAVVNDTNPSHIFNNQTLFINNYLVSLIVVSQNGCTDTTVQTVTVYPEPRFNFQITPDSGCSPLFVNFPSVVGAVDYQWDFGDGTTGVGPSPNHLYVNNTTNDLTLTVRLIAQNSFGCYDTTFGDVLVYPSPTAQFTLDTNVGCQPLPIQITNTSTGANFFDWDFGNGDTSSNNSAIFTKVYNNSSATTQFNTLELIVSTDKGCRDTASRLVQVHPFVEASFLSDSAGCSPFNAVFSNQSVGASLFRWDFGDGDSSLAQNPSHRYVNTTLSNQTLNAKLRVVSPQGCVDSANRDITIYPKPQALFTVNDSIGCHPFPVTFNNNSVLADSCLWTYGDNNVFSSCALSNQHTYNNNTSFFPINYQARLFVFTDNGCRDTLQRTIRVNPEIIADFNADSVGCSPFSVRFQNQSSGGQNYLWDYGDGGSSNAPNPRHFFINSGLQDTIFQVQLKAVSQYNCSDSISKSIRVLPKPIADYALNTTAGCHPLPVQFTNTSSLNDSCIWTFGDGFGANNCGPQINHTYTNTLSLVPVNYNSRLIVLTNEGCRDTLSRSITVNPQVIADFSSDTVGCSPLPVTFRSQSFGAINYFWDYGDGGLGNGMISAHTFDNFGSVDSIYRVRLIASSLFGCNDTAYQDILVHPTPQVNFTATPPFQTFPNATVNLVNSTNAGNWAFRWEYGDTNTSFFRDPGLHTYSTWGVYTIKLVASSAFCSDSTTQVVEIDVPVPIADFSDTASGCGPLTVSFTNESQYGASFLWEFGDGGTSTAENPTYTYLQPGDYDVSLRVNGFGPNKTDFISRQDYIRVFKSPQAAFFTNKDKVFIPSDPLVMFNSSVDADSYLWDFGDGGTSTEESPTYFYTTEGEFQISLIASSLNGCVDTFLLPSTVIAELQGTVRMPNAFTPNRNGSNGGRVNPLASLEGLNDVFYAKISGVTKYELNIFNKWGELLFVSTDVNIGWDGYYKGELCKQDAYVWKVTAEFADGKTLVQTGDLLLLR